MRLIPIGESEGFDVDRLIYYKFLPPTPRTPKSALLKLILDGNADIINVSGEKAETVFAFLRSLSHEEATDRWPLVGSMEAAEFGVRHPETIPLMPTAEPGPILDDEASYSVPMEQP